MNTDKLSRLKTAHRWTLVLTVALVLGLGLLLSLLLERTHQSESKSAALQLSAGMARELEQHLTRNLSATYALAALVRQGRGEIRNFDDIASEFISLHPGVSALQLAPGGVIRQVVPLAGNEKAIGHNLLLDEQRNKEALLAVKTRKLTLAGPFELRQGGVAMIGRLPVFMDADSGRFWGFTTVLIRMDDFFRTTGIDTLQQQGYNYQLWRTHPDTGIRHVFARSSGDLGDTPVTSALEVPNGLWHLSLAPANGWLDMSRLGRDLALAALLAALATWLMSLYLRAQWALAASNERHRALYKKTPAIMHSIDAEGKIISVSDYWLEQLGYSRDEVIGRKSTEFLTEASRQFAQEHALPEFFRTGALRDIPYQLQTRGGSIMDVLLSATAERNADGRIERSLAVMTDITASKRAEQELLDAKSYAENLIQTANVLIVELDLDGKLVHFNHTAECVTGYRLNEIRGQHWFELLVPRTAYPQVWAEFEKVIAGGGQVDEFENPILTNNGDERHIAWRNSPILRHGQVVGTLSFGIDITERKLINDRLQQSEASLLEAQGIAHLGNWSFDLKTKTLFWSREVFGILEIDLDTPPTSERFMGIVHPDDQERVRMAYRSFRQRFLPYEITCRLLLPDGNLKYVSQHSRTIFGVDGKPQRLIGTLQDVTLQALQDIALKESEDRFRTIADYTYDWEYWQGPQNEILYISPSCERITGYSTTEFICNPDLMTLIVHPEDRDVFTSHKLDVTDKPHGDLVFRIVTKDGQTRWIAHGCRAVYSGDGEARGRRGSNRDITELKQAEQLAHQLAYFDSLTNLPNRRMLMDRLRHALGQARRFQRSLAIMFLDLDRFKQINDTLGHDAGDKLLIEVGARLSRSVRQGDTVSRTGGDEFIIVLPEISHPDDATTVAGKILSALDAPIQLNGHTVKTSTSIGIAVYPIDGTDDADEMMKKADDAMYQAKKAGRNQYRVFTSRTECADIAS